jgi:hypothetical protein
MAKNKSSINIYDYGVVRERSEGTLYLMRKSPTTPGWAEEVAVRLDCGWVKTPDNQSKYMVLQSHVTWAEEANRSELIKILEEAEKNVSVSSF